MSKGSIKFRNIISEIENWMVIVLFSAMVVVTMAIVLCRYVFQIQFIPGEEIARYLMIWCGYAGTTMGFRTHAHVGVVVFSEKFPKSWQPAIFKIRHILSAVIVVVLFVICCLCFNQYVVSGQMTTATHIPMALVYIILPVSMAISILHNIVDIKEDFALDEKDKEGGEVKQT